MKETIPREGWANFGLGEECLENHYMMLSDSQQSEEPRLQRDTATWWQAGSVNEPDSRCPCIAEGQIEMREHWPLWPLGAAQGGWGAGEQHPADSRA